MSNELADSRPY